MILHVATLLFVTLKSLGYIDWSWWLVFAPSIFAFVMGTLILAFSFALVYFNEKGFK
jgi:hypothetical protein